MVGLPEVPALGCGGARREAEVVVALRALGHGLCTSDLLCAVQHILRVVSSNPAQRSALMLELDPARVLAAAEEQGPTQIELPGVEAEAQRGAADRMRRRRSGPAAPRRGAGEGCAWRRVALRPSPPSVPRLSLSCAGQIRLRGATTRQLELGPAAGAWWPAGGAGCGGGRRMWC